MKKSKTLKKKQNNKITPVKLGWIIGVGLATFLLAYYSYGAKPQKAEVFLIDSSSTQYGETKLIGKIQKDTAADVEGNYFLIISDNKPILLDTQQPLDELLGLRVVVNGYLTPETALGQPATLKIYTLKLE